MQSLVQTRSRTVIRALVLRVCREFSNQAGVTPRYMVFPYNMTVCSQPGSRPFGLLLNLTGGFKFDPCGCYFSGLILV
jgi:hypothetical protein